MLTVYTLPATKISAEDFDELRSDDLVAGETFRIADAVKPIALVRDDKTVMFYSSVGSMMEANKAPEKMDNPYTPAGGYKSPLMGRSHGSKIAS